MCGTYGSSNSLHPCHFCLVDRYAMNDVHIADNDINIRNEDETINSLRNGEAKLISMHHIRNALWKRPDTIKILEKRLSKIPRYPNLKVFKNGFERLVRLTAAEYRDLMKIILFALDDLLPDKKINKDLCKLFSLWIDMYIWSCKHEYTESDLHEFENAIIVWSDLFINYCQNFRHQT
ncbi:unnamed protein product [Rhizophagus irregularis]|nr:unnamed protein product [Rhizophagus irregularis]